VTLLLDGLELISAEREVMADLVEHRIPDLAK
jgi:hypothetical protein